MMIIYLMKVGQTESIPAVSETVCVEFLIFIHAVILSHIQVCRNLKKPKNKSVDYHDEKHPLSVPQF